MEGPPLSRPVPVFLRTEKYRNCDTLNHDRHCFLVSRLTAKSSWKPITTNHETEANHVLDSINSKNTTVGNLDSLNLVHHSSYDLDTSKTNHSSKDIRGKERGHQALMLQAQLADALVAHHGKRKAVSQDHFNAILAPRPLHQAQSWRAPPASLLSKSKGLHFRLTPSSQHPLKFLHTIARQQRPFTRSASTVQPPPAPAPATPPDPTILPPPNHKAAQRPSPKPTTSRPTTLAQASIPHPTSPPHQTPHDRPPPDLATLKSDPKFRSLSRKWTSLMVALPIALYTTWVLLERCKWRFPFRLLHQSN
jgi:hypothetical protein